jgi:hypothetical protein
MLRFETCQKPAWNGHCCGVADENPCPADARCREGKGIKSNASAQSAGSISPGREKKRAQPHGPEGGGRASKSAPGAAVRCEDASRCTMPAPAMHGRRRCRLHAGPQQQGRSAAGCARLCGPKNEIEGALAVQMACTHCAAMAVLSRTGRPLADIDPLRPIRLRLQNCYGLTCSRSRRCDASEPVERSM